MRRPRLLRLAHTLAAFLTSGLLTSCSYFTDFVITNRGAQAVQMRYGFAPPDGATMHCPLEEGPTRGETIEGILGDRFEPSGPLPGGRLDVERCTASASIAPGASVSIFRTTNFVPSNSVDRALLERLTVELVGQSTTLRVEPGQALGRFDQRSEQLYELVYQ